jgi:hypothetical protein
LQLSTQPRTVLYAVAADSASSKASTAVFTIAVG